MGLSIGIRQGDNASSLSGGFKIYLFGRVIFTLYELEFDQNLKLILSLLHMIFASLVERL